MSEPRHWLLDRDAHMRRRLDAGTIVERAHELVHEGGSAALSMRILASSLDTSTSALYRHVPSKQWLLVAIVDHVLADLDTAPAYERRRSSRARLASVSRSYRDLLAEHPHLHEILTSQVALTPNSVRIADAILTCLRDGGIPDHELVHAYNAWCGYVIGFSILETKPPEHAPEQHLKDAMREELRHADPAAFPIVARLMGQLANRAYGLRWQGDELGNGHRSFDWGLDALLDGYERRGARPRGSQEGRKGPSAPMSP